MPAPWEEYAAAAAKPWEEYAAAPIARQSTNEQPQPESGMFGNFSAGAVRGAGSIGATLLSPVDWLARKAGIQNDYIGRTDRRDAMTQALGDALGFDTNSKAFGVGKLTGEVAGTAGAGGVLANGVRALNATRMATGIEPIINGVAHGLESGGFRVGELAGTSAALPTRIATGALTGGAAAGMVNPSDATIGAAIGGTIPAIAQGLGLAAQKVGRSLTGETSPEVRALAQQAQDLNIQIPADRLTNSRPLNALASSLNYVPFSGRAATEARMNSQLNQAVSRTFGQDSSNVTQALRKAEDVLGSKFDTFLQSNNVQMTPKFSQALDDAASQATTELSQDQAGIILRQIQSIRDKAASGAVEGQTAYNIKKTLDRIGNRNSPEAWYALDLKGKLMDALNESVGATKASDFAQLRQQYGNMLSLQKLAKNGAEGEISAARLANMQNINNAPLQQVADIAAQFVKPREGMHGAAQRVYGAAGGLGVPTMLAAFGVPGAAAAAAGTGAVMGAGRLTNGLLNSQMAKDFVLGGGSLLGEPQSMGLLTQGLTRLPPILAVQ